VHQRKGATVSSETVVVTVELAIGLSPVVALELSVGAQKIVIGCNS
jgi:hypothetical protein